MWPPQPPGHKGCCQELEDPVTPAAADDASALLEALADPTRIRMLAMFDRPEEPICVCDFTAAFRRPRAACT